LSEKTTPEETPAESAPAAEEQAPAEPAKASNKGRKIAIALVGLAVVLFVYHLFADRLTPYSSSGYVRTYLVAIAPEVNGTIYQVNVDDNTVVAQDDVLFRIDPRDYQIAVDAAEAQLAQAGQSIGANTAQVSSAQAALSEAKADLENTREQSARVLTLVEQGVYAAARADKANAELDSAIARVEQAEANLVQAQEALGPEGEDNPLLRAALADLDKARLNLLRTTVRAPSEGVVTGLQLAPGEQARVGQDVMVFLDLQDVWLVSYLSENNLGLVKPGDPVEIAFDVHPGAIFDGVIQSTGLGIAVDDTTAGGTLPSGQPGRSVTGSDNRFPVRILFDERPGNLRFGGRASVIVYPTDNGLMNTLGWLRIRLASLWNYVN
jgi:multidrug resistance efflux pump